MDNMFAAALAKRGQGANVLPQQGAGVVPPTFQAPGEPAANEEATPIGVKVFDKESNTELEVTSVATGTEAQAGASKTAEADVAKAADAAVPTDPLTPEEVLQLTQAENRIKAFGKAAADAGEAFQEIRDNHLQRHYGLTWAQYCPQHWGWSASQVDRFIRAAPVMRALHLPNEATAREFTTMYETWGADTTRAVWKGAVEGAGGKGTAKAARIAVQSITESVEEGEAPPSPEKLSEMAREAVTQAAARPAARPGSRPTAAKAEDEQPAADQDTGHAADASAPDAPAAAWAVPAEAARELADLIVKHAEIKGSTPEEEFEHALDVLRRHYDGAAATE
ncbi:hypothetical protein ACFWA9_38275 [Kitasatospora sp. NPDC059973]|uniref:hypothetical protein n=1 Tax=Kitasatospora sp. NPDC059973 TaxID=3347020 RepID=UPI0036927F7D